MHRARLTRHPVLPKSIEETQESIEKLDLATSTGENFLLSIVTGQQKTNNTVAQ